MSTLVLPRQNIETFAQARTPDEFKELVFKLVGNLSDVDVMYNQVLLAIYIRPEKTRGGIIRPTSNVEEDVWQGKAGLVLKVGPNAFEDDAEYQFHGQRANVGDWCGFKVGDAWSVEVNMVPCRLVRDSAIKLKVKDPNIIL